jgi:pimeloyl-ACP methyl ester carboxylesterase
MLAIDPKRCRVSLSPDQQSERRQQLWSLLGRLPNSDPPISSTIIGEKRHPAGFVLQQLRLELNGIEPVSAYFAWPDSGGPSRLPAVLYHHSHGARYDIGKDELLVARDYMQFPGYAEALTAAGFAVLCIDCWNFGERHKRTESSLFKEMLWNGQVVWGMMVYDAVRALDYLASRDDVDSQRIGTMGMSMGSTMAWWLAALDERIRACVDICCLTDFHALIQSGGLDEHGLYYYVPGLLNHFTTAQINELICPRPHLALVGTRDPLTPAIGLDTIDEQLTRLYKEAGAADAWKLTREDVGHQETREMRAAAIDWLRRWLF